ncbi:universal stress protein [Rhizobium sp.]|uniref:universal stress protein n=1 Tax=Rhizobium sp. TaxID=391 RepID=UPI003917F471
MLLPNRKDATLRPKRIVLGWNGRREAWIAVRSSIHLLQKASRVHVAVVEVEDANSADLATFLTRHGVEVVIDHLQGSDDPAIVLQRHAESLDADLIVMGAYGHSRLAERILGGTTQTMLQHPAVPVLMAR